MQSPKCKQLSLELSHYFLLLLLTGPIDERYLEEGGGCFRGEKMKDKNGQYKQSLNGKKCFTFLSM